jgi:hypothetical protein
MACDHYDILIPGHVPVTCECGRVMFGGEVAFFDQIEGKPCCYVRCLSCAIERKAPPIPVEIVDKSMRLTRDYFAHAMAAALTVEPTKQPIAFEPH